MKFTSFTQSTRLSFCSRRITSWCMWLGLNLHQEPCLHSTTTAASGTCLTLLCWLFYRKLVLPDWISNFLAVWHLDCHLILRLKGYDIFHSNDYRKPWIQAADTILQSKINALKNKGWYFLPVTKISSRLAPSYFVYLRTLQKQENTFGEWECFDCRLEQWGTQVLLSCGI